MKRKSRTWRVNRHFGIEARRAGLYILADFGSTAHMIQGATLAAAFVELQHWLSKASMTIQIAAYVCLSRVKRLDSICVMQPFSPELFAHGNPEDFKHLLRELSGQITSDQAMLEWGAAEDVYAQGVREMRLALPNGTYVQ